METHQRIYLLTNK